MYILWLRNTIQLFNISNTNEWIFGVRLIKILTKCGFEEPNANALKCIIYKTIHWQSQWWYETQLEKYILRS